MVFSNTVVDLQTIPTAEDVPLQSVQPSFKKILWVEWCITALILLGMAIAGIAFSKAVRSSPGWWMIVSGATLVLGFYALSIHKTFAHLAYAVRERDVLLQKGWIVRRLRICPFNRIQNCSVQSGPLERRWGLASLTIYTAGNDNADMRLSGLTAAEADTLRRFILEQIHAEPDATN